MRNPINVSRFIGLLCLWGLAWTPEAAAQDASEVSFWGLSGVVTVSPGAEVLLYFIELNELPPPGNARDAEVKTVGAGNSEIRFSITDLTAPTGFDILADITALNFYRSADALFDGGDALQRSEPPVVGPNQTIDFGAAPIPDPDIPDAPASIFFLVTASIPPTATPGNAFRLGVPGGHIDIRDAPPPGPPAIYTLGTLVLANDANRVVIGGTPDAPSLPPIKIPVGYEWLAGLGFFAFGVYGLMRVRRRRAQQG